MYTYLKCKPCEVLTYFTKKTDEVRAMNKIKIELSQEKINFISYAY